MKKFNFILIIGLICLGLTLCGLQIHNLHVKKEFAVQEGKINETMELFNQSERTEKLEILEATIQESFKYQGVKKDVVVDMYKNSIVDMQQEFLDIYKSAGSFAEELQTLSTEEELFAFNAKLSQELKFLASEKSVTLTDEEAQEYVNYINGLIKESNAKIYSILESEVTNLDIREEAKELSKQTLVEKYNEELSLEEIKSLKEEIVNIANQKDNELYEHEQEAARLAEEARLEAERKAQEEPAKAAQQTAVSLSSPSAITSNTQQSVSQPSQPQTENSYSTNNSSNTNINNQQSSSNFNPYPEGTKWMCQPDKGDEFHDTADFILFNSIEEAEQYFGCPVVALPVYP